MPRFVPRVALLAGCILAPALWGIGCGSSAVPSPFAEDAGVDGAEGGDADAADAVDPTLGPPCLDDGQCDDGVDCTFDACDSTIERCRYTPDDSKCADNVYCDGLELCDPKLGCKEGAAVACDDNQTCTIDTCIEATKKCVSEPRDIDADSDSDWNCGGGDCNDTDPEISSKHVEVCGNAQDDDCDGQKDEADCQTPAHDKCADALEIDGPGQYPVSLGALSSDYAATCAGSGGTWRDAVIAVVVPAGPPQDVDVVATTSAGALALAAVDKCGDPSSETTCGGSFSTKSGGVISRLRLRGLDPGAHALYLFGTSSSDVVLKVKYGPATTQPTNETCGTAEPIQAGVAKQLSVIDAALDLTSDCQTLLGELVYELDLAQPQAVNVWASSVDGYATPEVSLWKPSCALPADEIGCNAATGAHVFQHALPAGKYYVAVSASAPSDIELLVELGPPSTPPADETCASGATLTANQTVVVPLAGHSDDVQLGCLSGAVDAAYSLDLTQKSDVLLVGRISDYDTGAVSLAMPACATSADLLACASDNNSPVRAAEHKLAAGSYRAVIETVNGAPTMLTAFVRPAVAPVLVAFADTCPNAVKIPALGGFFQGNTANVNADYPAGCDLGTGANAPDQLLKLDLPAKKRVVLDMSGSAYTTLLVVRKAQGCPGPEVPSACAAGYYQARSFLDLTLDPGSYYVQIDGYAGDAGAWFLEVYIVDP